MAGYVIHLAVAEQYIRKHKDENNNYEEFINGVIFPDSVKDKSKTHYGSESSKSNLYNFLLDKSLDTAFNRGYFLHLLTDYIFYNKYLDCISKDIYNDYDILNKTLIEKYNVNLPKEIQNSVFFLKGKLKILSLEMIEKLIEEISNMCIDEIKDDIIKDHLKWTKMKNLKRL
jgi:hypothetical protein